MGGGGERTEEGREQDGEGGREEVEERGRGGDTRYARRSAAVIGTPGKKAPNIEFHVINYLLPSYFFWP